MSDYSEQRVDYRETLDVIAEVIEAGAEYSYGYLPTMVRKRLDEIAANPSLPEPDVTNSDHLRFCADILDPMDGAVDSIYLRARADRLDAARTAEREREQRIEQAARAVFGTVHFDDELVTLDLLRVAARALDAAGLLRGGGRGE